MANHLGMAAQLAGNSLRFGWYYGLNWLLDREATRFGAKSDFKPLRPVPTRQQLLADLGQLFISDATAVRDGIYPPHDGGPVAINQHLTRLRRMFADLPGTLERRRARDAGSARSHPDAAGLPDYFTQDFHFQTGGYLSEDSAALYDIQVETLFYGSADVMRRSGLRPIVEFLRGRDQRSMTFLDVACGTGLFLRQVRQTYPALRLTGLDLSRPYLAEAQRHLRGLRPAQLLAANAEQIPLADASQDVVACIFLYHELPPEVRQRVTAEIARVLKPAGLFVFIDSLQMGDRPDWDGLLEAFPVRFHEPYFRNYVTADLEAMFAAAGLVAQTAWPAFLSKVMVRRKQPPACGPL